MQSEFIKGTTTPWPTFSPQLNPQWAHLQRKICCVCSRKWWVITLQTISSFPPPENLWVTPIRGDFLFVQTWNVMNEQLYSLLAGGSVISSGTLSGPTRCFLTYDWVCCTNVHVCTPSCALMHWPLKQHIMRIQWSPPPERAAQPGCTHTAAPHAYAETQITLFYYLSVKGIYGVIKELHNESGWLFKF